jgi:glyoxylase-like metal-dependent hydrolase (beta-lactamase superfamily II)/rhodanese-related sulfurtransferase
MNIQQLYTNCLAHGAYYIESNGEAAVIDPLRDVDTYLNMAYSRGAKIKYIFETHFHADFVSGHVDLARKTGAAIVFGPTQMHTGFVAHIAKDGEEFKLGQCTIKLIHTPGHTMESSCFLLSDENGKEMSIFTGDTLFIGNVGRPDLAQHVIADLTQEKLAAHLYDSLHNKILPLSNDLIVYPGHGAGSACGKNMSKETSDTLGHQKETNYALNANLTKQEFISELLNGLTLPPSYFPKNVLMNIQGYDSVDKVMLRGTKALSANAVETLSHEKDILIVDVRKAEDFAKAHIPGSWNIGLEGQFAVWAGTVIKDINQKIVLVAEPGTETQAVTRLARVGYDHAIGFLEGGIQSWIQQGKPTSKVEQIEASALVEVDASQVLDVRKKSEYDSEHVEGYSNLPLDYYSSNLSMLQNNKTYYVHCAGGYRSMIFISILKSIGFINLIDVKGGFNAMKATGKFKTTDYVCPSTLL